MILGLTGGIASGKTSVSNIFSEYGCEIFDADIVAREVVDKGSQGLEKLVSIFGREILTTEGDLHRKVLRHIIFENPISRKTVNQIMHPLIHSRIKVLLESALTDIKILSVPLLFENHYEEMCDAVVIVDMPNSMQLSRGALRDNDNRQNIAKIIAVQMPREIRLCKANFVIDNSGEISKTRKQCHLLMQKLSIIFSL